MTLSNNITSNSPKNPQKTAPMEPNQIVICRACLQNVETSSYFYIDTFDNTQIANTIPKDVLQVCIPEMDLYISEQPGVCRECLGMFETFYNFKNQCLASEERILTYLKKHKISPQSKINLVSVLHDVVDPQLNKSLAVPGLPGDDGEIILGENANSGIVIVSNGRGGATDNSPEDQTEVMLLSCNECSFVATDVEKLTNHKCVTTVANPASARHKCPYCDYSSARRYRLSYHVNAKHTKANWYPCTHCEYKTTDMGSLKRHQKVVHCMHTEGAPVFSCAKCEFQSFSEVALQRHIVSKHGPVVQQCTMCQYQTKDKSNFRKHLYVHGDKPRKCTQCSYQCVSPYQLEKHYKKFHV